MLNTLDKIFTASFIVFAASVFSVILTPDQVISNVPFMLKTFWFSTVCVSVVTLGVSFGIKLVKNK